MLLPKSIIINIISYFAIYIKELNYLNVILRFIIVSKKALQTIISYYKINSQYNFELILIVDTIIYVFIIYMLSRTYSESEIYLMHFENLNYVDSN